MTNNQKEKSGYGWGTFLVIVVTVMLLAQCASKPNANNFDWNNEREVNNFINWLDENRD